MEGLLQLDMRVAKAMMQSRGVIRMEVSSDGDVRVSHAPLGRHVHTGTRVLVLHDLRKMYRKWRGGGKRHLPQISHLG